MADLVTCPWCGGNLGGHGFVHRTTGCSVEYIPCRACDDTGKVDRDKAERFERGRRLSDLRQQLDLGLREAAAQVGIRAVELADLEHGRSPIRSRYDAAEARLRAMLPEVGA